LNVITSVLISMKIYHAVQKLLVGETQTDKQAGRQTGRQVDRQKDRLVIS
jgi:hypothetical protein